MGYNWNAINNTLSDAVLQSGRLDELLDGLGCRGTRLTGGTIFRGPCPVHRGIGQNFEVLAGGHTLPVQWRCFSRKCHRHPKFKPSLLGLVRGVLSDDPDRPVSLTAAKQYLEGFLRQPARAARQPNRLARPRREDSTLNLTRDEVRRRLVIPSPYFLGRGFRADVLDSLNIGDSPRLGRAVVPIWDDTGLRCVGFISRSVHPTCPACKTCHPIYVRCSDGEPRWQFPPGFPKGDWLYNYAAARASDGDAVLLVEGVPDVLRATEVGIPAVAGFGTDLSPAQVAILAALNKMAVVMFDNDPAGREGAVALSALLRGQGIHVQMCHPPREVKDLAEVNLPDAARHLCRFVSSGRRHSGCSPTGAIHLAS